MVSRLIFDHTFSLFRVVSNKILVTSKNLPLVLILNVEILDKIDLLQKMRQYNVQAASS